MAATNDERECSRRIIVHPLLQPYRLSVMIIFSSCIVKSYGLAGRLEAAGIVERLPTRRNSYLSKATENGETCLVNISFSIDWGSGEGCPSAQLLVPCPEFPLCSSWYQNSQYCCGRMVSPEILTTFMNIRSFSLVMTNLCGCQYTQRQSVYHVEAKCALDTRQALSGCVP